ncbi:MAG TPA: hypothetical protein VGE41_09065, partial [Verrucomicrobiae bacterium]
TADVRQRSSTLTSAPVDLWVKAGYEFQINKCFIYYTTDGTNPEGAYGVGQGTTQVAPGSFAADDASDGTIDWWKGTIPAQPLNTLVKYKIGLYKEGANPIPDSADSKHYALTQFAITNWNPATGQVWLHNDLATNQIATGLAEGFHILRARSFLPRSGKASVYNTFLQTFYYDTQPPNGVIAFPANDGDTLRSVDYDFVIRTDETATSVEYNISDGDPNNDDAITALNNGNGSISGTPVFAKASLVSPLASLNQQYPNLPQEFRFTYFAVPSNGTATITVRIKEISSGTLTNHYRTLTRTITAAAPPQTLTIAFPAANSPVQLSNPTNTYELVACFSDTLTADINLFSITIDGALQPRTNSTGAALYRFVGSFCGAGKRDLRYTWSGINPGQHYLQINYVGDGLALQASRLVNVSVATLPDADGDGLPDFWENQYGLNPNSSVGDNGPDGDPDHDGFTNLQEYLAGTNPRDPNSLLKIYRLTTGPQIVSWQSVPGKNYQVFTAPDITYSFDPIGVVMTAVSTNSFFTNSSPLGLKQFYRVQVQQ